MSDELKLGALGQISMRVSDVAAAERFYHGVLGLPHIFTFDDLAFFDCDGTRLFCSAMEEGDRPAGSSVLYFEVPDLDGAYDELQAKGVQFQAAPHLIFRHDDGVEEWMAFFSDPFDNQLALMARVEAS